MLEAGKKAASIRRIRSKAEIKLFDLCSGYFNKVENNKIIMDGWDADIVIDNHILILWNVPWHYKNIKMKGVSLSQIQKRDEIKVNKFLDAGFQVLIYEDRYFTPETAFKDIQNHVIEMDTEAGVKPLMRF